ncbi:MAG: lactonase family protein [Solirubrobacterales bacterium]
MRKPIAYRVAVPALAVLALAGAVATAASASRAGAPTLLGCVTGNNRVAAAQGCGTVPGSGGRADDAGMNGVTALAGGGSGPALYAIGNENSAITQLLTRGSAGRLAFAACFTGNAFIERSCPAVPGAYANADQAPIAAPTAAAISPDGRSLYLVSGNFHGSVVARFSREPLSGALTYLDCLTGDTDPGPTGVLACNPIPTATRDGYGSGLNQPTGIVISRDGRHAYVTAGLDQSLTTFARDPASGALTFAGCLSSNESATHCRQLPVGRDVLDEVGSPLLSADGRYLYAAASRSATIDSFRIGAAGRPSFAGCLGGRGEEHGCRYGKGPVSALELPTGLAASADGRFVYATSGYGAILVLRRQAANGTLTPVSCLSATVEQGRVCKLTPGSAPYPKTSVLGGIRAPLLSPDGRRLLAAVRTQDAIVELRRDRRSGALSFLGCATGSLRVAAKGVCKPIPGATKHGGASGFHKLTALAPGPAGSIYAAAAADATVWALRP